MPFAYVRVKCPCGRDLRAKPEQAGASITCWSCHASVFVPVPVAPGDWVIRVLRVTARQILDARTITLLAIGAVTVTLALSITSLGLHFGPATLAWLPRPGVWAAALALALVMVGYGELVRRGCEGDWAPRPHVGPVARAWRVFVCLGASVLLVTPLVIASAGQSPPRVTPAGLAIGLVACLVWPLIMLGTYEPRGTVSQRVRLVLATLKRHPVALIGTLLMVPLALPVVEAIIFTLTRLTGTFSFLLFDVFPSHAGIRFVNGLPYYARGELRMNWYEFREASDALIMGTYGESLSQGFTLIGTLPASLAMDTSNHLFRGALGMEESGYLALRMFFTLVMVGCMLGVLAVQARWLGLLSTIDRRRSASSVSTGLFQLPNLSPETP